MAAWRRKGGVDKFRVKLVGGLLAHFGPRVPFMVAAGLSLCNFLYGLLVLPESLPPERRMAFSSLTTSAATRGEGPSVTSTTPGRPTAR